MTTVCVGKAGFEIDGKNVQLISGAIHYFRVHPGLWDDRLDKAVSFGLNAVETYVPWNLHETHRGRFDFSGGLDLALFLRKVKERGLYAILRPGPYICAEHDGGGFPGWLTVLPGIELRRVNKPFFAAATSYLSAVFKQVKPLLAANGGPIIAMQVENEYGSYAHDKKYLNALRDFYIASGIDVPLFTSDGGGDHFLNGGMIDGCLACVNFGSHHQEAFAAHRSRRPDEPDFCMEFWDGWFDHWGEQHHARPGSEVADELSAMLKTGASVNFYMFHGGTNFGFTNGANGNTAAEYSPTVTSYDYDAPLSEAGDPTEKFDLCQEVIRRHTRNMRISTVLPGHRFAPPPVQLRESVLLRDNLDKLSTSTESAVTPKTMEQLGETFGFVHYVKHLEGPVASCPLRLTKVNDYAQVWLDGKYLGSRYRDDGANPFNISIPDGGAELEVLVENCGHVNYGPLVGQDFKGIAGSVAIDLQIQLDWLCRALPLDSLSRLGFGAFSDEPASFHRATFHLKDIKDTFLRFPGVKGVVWLNGFNLGRYWNRGPGDTLYIPAPALRRGMNEIVVLELEKLNSDTLEFTAERGQ